MGCREEADNDGFSVDEEEEDEGRRDGTVGAEEGRETVETGDSTMEGGRRETRSGRSRLSVIERAVEGGLRGNGEGGTRGGCGEGGIGNKVGVDGREEGRETVALPIDLMVAGRVDDVDDFWDLSRAREAESEVIPEAGPSGLTAGIVMAACLILVVSVG